MSDKLGFYELLNPQFSLGLVAQNVTGSTLRDLRDANSLLQSTLPGASTTLSRIVTEILDYLSVEELHTASDETAIVYRGSAKFGGEGRANPASPDRSAVKSASGQELSWLDNMIDFRLTIPRRGAGLTLNTSGLTGADLSDLQQSNTLFQAFADTPVAAVTDLPGADFRLELLIRTVRVVLPKENFIPARVGVDGWLEPDPAFSEVVFEFPRLAFVLEQQEVAGNLDLTLKSWDAAGFDDPGDIDTARLFTLTPPLFLHSSRRVGFGIERVVADFSDNVTPPEILEQFGIGDDFNGFWLPLVRVFIAPGRTTGLALSARGKDLLFDFDKGFSGELALDILNRGGKLEVQPIFYRPDSKIPLELNRGPITRGNDGTTTVGQGDVTLPGDAELHLSIRGSISPYQVSVELSGDQLTPDVTAGPNRPKWMIQSAVNSDLVRIQVTDNGNHNRWNETILIRMVAPPAPKPPPAKRYEVIFTDGGGDPGHTIELVEHETGDQAAMLRLLPDIPVPVLQVILPVNQNIPRRPDGLYRMILTPGDRDAHIVAIWNTPPPPVSAAPLTVDQQISLVRLPDIGSKLYFELTYPIDPLKSPQQVVENLFDSGVPFFGSIGLSSESLSASREQVIAVFQSFLNATSGDIVISGFASFRQASNFTKDQELSDLRCQIVELILRQLLGNTSRQIWQRGYTHAAAEKDKQQDSDPVFRVAIATAAPATTPKQHTGTLRLEEIIRPPVADPPVEHAPEATEPERPPIFRRIGFRVRFERSELVLGEVSGQFDFRTQAEETAGFIQTGDSNAGTTDIVQAVKTPPQANQAGEQGVLDYRLTISYDTATRRLTEVLALGFDQQSRDGWVSLDTFSPLKLANTLGSLLIFAPLLNAGIDSAVDANGTEAIKNAIIAGAEVAIATTLGVTGMIRFIKFTLFGIELSATELLPDDQSEQSTQLGNIAAMFDYAVDFDVNIELGILTITSKRDQNNFPVPTRVRYRGFGFRIDIQDPNHYQAVFDTSKGFDLGLAEPGALIVGGPLGPLLRVDSVRVARQNPLILEMDLGINANLGVITIDTVRVRIPVEPLGTPTIIPTGISVNIPGTLVGSGFLDIRDSGFTGAIDITLVPLRLRIQASVGLERLADGERQITAFFLGLGVEFPAPIPLANSGLGLYGLLGLFGMHYQRAEEPPSNPNLPIALDWYYNKAKGEPHQIAVNGVRTWVAAPDRWSFGVGLVLGTMEGAFILNLKGMLVLELPGPRILVFAKAQILAPRPPAGKPADQAVGLLAVVDLNFQVGYIAIGLIFTYEIKKLLRIEVPIDAQFNFHDIEDWHLYIGSLRNKASADILGIAKGTAYLMFDGKGIPDFPLAPLQGFSIAAGIAASLVIGDERSGLYAKVSGSLDMGVSTAPLHMFGQMKLEGRIHLWFIGLGASAKLDIEAPEPLFVKGTVCGSIDLWLTSIEGCVGITIGQPQPLPEPELLASGLSLQSHSPALIEGQGTDQPIDSSFGVSHSASEIIQNVPLDAIPVLQLQYPPVFSAAATGLLPSSSAPTLPPGSDGWFSLGGIAGQEGERELRYEIDSLTISPALPSGITEIPVTWWQPARPNAPADSQSTDKAVNLAINSWIPVPFPRSYQRSQQQQQTIRDRFEVICKNIAPATRVLWTFNAHFTITVNGLIRNPRDPFPGPSVNGWKLNGFAWPDPPDTQRSNAPKTRLAVHEPDYSYRTNQLVLNYATKLTGEVFNPAQVVPAAGGAETGQALQLPFLQVTPGMQDAALSEEATTIAKQFLEQAGNRQRIVVESGDVTDVRLLVATNSKQKVIAFLTIRAFDASQKLVEQLLVPTQQITSMAQLPAQWQDATGPWNADVQRVFNFFSGQFGRSHSLFLVEWKPSVPIASFEVCYEPAPPLQKPFQNPPPVMLGVVETLSRAEVERVTAQQHYQDAMIDVVVNSLQEGDKRPLLAPDTTYTITLHATGTIRKANAPATTRSRTIEQQFKFHTAAQSPTRLNPWMLAMLPENDVGDHFVNDPVQFIFNDASVIQLFKLFGKSLRAVLRKANGNHPPTQPVIDLPQLQPVQGQIRSPFAQTLLDLVSDMPCIPQITETEHHQVFTLEIVLERGTAYMLDIESTPASENPLTPLYRTAFSTSRFVSAAELARVVSDSFVQERALRDLLTITSTTRSFLIPDNTAASHSVSIELQTTTDAALEGALLSALGSELPPAHQPGVTLLWSAQTPARPIAFLIDAPESLLRTRQAPVEVQTPTPDDDIIQHFQLGQQLWLQVAEQGSAVAERIVYASSGCRVLVFLKPTASGSMRLVLRQYRHLLLTNEAVSKDALLVDVVVPIQAPWEV